MENIQQEQEQILIKKVMQERNKAARDKLNLNLSFAERLIEGSQ